LIGGVCKLCAEQQRLKITIISYNSTGTKDQLTTCLEMSFEGNEIEIKHLPLKYSDKQNIKLAKIERIT